MSDLTGVGLPHCTYCGMWHTGICPRIKAITYRPDGGFERVEFHPPPDASRAEFHPPPDASRAVAAEREAILSELVARREKQIALLNFDYACGFRDAIDLIRARGTA